jgi:hypothetical protein
MRAADNWESPRFSGIFLALGFFCFQADSSPAQLQLTQAVRRSAKFFLNARANQLGFDVIYRQHSSRSIFCPNQNIWQVFVLGFFTKVGSGISPAKVS